jgi:hypothetical protein
MEMLNVDEAALADAFRLANDCLRNAGITLEGNVSCR